MTSLLLRVLPWLALIGVAWFGGCEYQKGRQLATEIAVLQNEVRRVDTVYRADTVRLTRVRLKTDSVLLIDTLIHRDTVVQIVERERRACDAVIATCEQRVAYRDSVISKLEKRKGTDWKTKLGLILGGAAAGVLITTTR